ncbi:MAG: methylated-DNA--[protein]-cysteine S-methyltransferase [Chloroflexota bacterium]
MIITDHLDNTPLGTIWAAANENGLVAVSLWEDADRFAKDLLRLTGEKSHFLSNTNLSLTQALAELDAYLRGELRTFEVPIDWTILKTFQRQVLEHVYKVHYGQTSTYQAIADQLGKPGAVRAVGRANATNPMPIVIPCHRILGSDGKLHGYGARGGIETKARLLRMEGSWLI